MINSIFQSPGDTLDPQITSIIILIFLFGLLFGVAIMLTSWGDKSQLLKPQIYLLTVGITVIPSYVYLVIMYLQNGNNFFDVSLTFGLIAIVILVPTGIFIKFFTYRTISIKEIQNQEAVEKDKVILKAEDLRVYYPIYKGMLKRHIADVKAVDGVSFEVKSGETLGLVGESGCGKTTIARTILGLVKKNSGQLYFNDEPLTNKFTQDQRQKIQMIFQDPDASLNPQKKIVDIIAEPLINLLGMSDRIKVRERVLQLLEIVSLKREHMDRFPHEFSGGQKQRIIIARSLACNPQLIVLDEPTSALDVSVQAQILNLLKDLQRKYGYAYIFITHDLSVVHHIADRISVMYLGKFVETGKVDKIFDNTSHPYSQALLSARSEIDPEQRREKIILKGEVPSAINPPSGCYFNPRCSSETRGPECSSETPHMIEIEDDHFIWCVNPPK